MTREQPKNGTRFPENLQQLPHPGKKHSCKLSVLQGLRKPNQVRLIKVSNRTATGFNPIRCENLPDQARIGRTAKIQLWQSIPIPVEIPHSTLDCRQTRAPGVDQGAINIKKNKPAAHGGSEEALQTLFLFLGLVFFLILDLFEGIILFKVLQVLIFFKVILLDQVTVTQLELTLSLSVRQR